MKVLRFYEDSLHDWTSLFTIYTEVMEKAILRDLNNSHMEYYARMNTFVIASHSVQNLQIVYHGLFYYRFSIY